MFKKISCLLCASLFVGSVAFGSFFANYPKSLEGPIQRLLAFEKAEAVLDQAQKQGGISVRLAPFSVSTSNAMWRPDNRTIVLNSRRDRNEGEIIRSILFEMHNAKNHHKFEKLDRLARGGHIDKEAYVREIEWLEHQNALETKRILDDAMAMGAYPNTVFWPIHEEFEAHYKLQQLAGHSQFIAQVYDTLNPKGKHTKFKGTIPFNSLSKKQKQEYLVYLSKQSGHITG